MDDITLEQSIAQLLTKVPAPVQEFVLNDLGQTTNLLMAAHNLHIDQAGVLERELLLMLLGQEEPAQFAAELKAAGVDEATTQAILKDVNERVFKRLRTQERAEGIAPAAPSAPKERSWVEVTPRPASAPLTPVPAYTPPAPKSNPVPAPQPAVVSAPSIAPIRTMAGDMKEAQHEERKPRGAQQLPGASIPVPPPVPHQTIPPVQVSTSAQPIARPAPPPAPAPPKAYGADPYREPIT